MRSVNALVMTGYGINCHEETAAAYRMAGAQAEIVHCHDLITGRVSVHDFDLVTFPGGFSFGDDLGAGKALANKVRYRRLPGGSTLLDELQRFLAAGKFVLGICNGFQVLVKSGLLPNVRGTCQQEATLTVNDSGVFEDRWVQCRALPHPGTPFLQGIDRIDLPVRHKEGKLIFRDDALRARIVSEGLNCLSYCDAAGQPTLQYPHNPNGSVLACAALRDPTGHVLGLMPHPEAYLSALNHPDWGHRFRQDPGLSPEGEGLRLFQNIIAHCRSPEHT
jgi:phosphoribosylformylglycinamidine synthase